MSKPDKRTVALLDLNIKRRWWWEAGTCKSIPKERRIKGMPDYRLCNFHGHVKKCRGGQPYIQIFTTRRFPGLGQVRDLLAWGKTWKEVLKQVSRKNTAFLR